MPFIAAEGRCDGLSIIKSPQLIGHHEEGLVSLYTLVEHIRDVYLDQTMVFYAGAGISYDCPSHLPLGGQLARAVISGFYEALDGPKRETFETALDYLTLEELC
jgi:hypothetical protein